MSEQLLQSLKSRTKELVSDSIETLKDYLSLPTISAQNNAIPETVEFVVTQIQGAGGKPRF
ncbi:hypothetical protein ACOI1C_21885 [Bacillus sp. DJP31]|uniref:hypothetical protein n=1 Tax=Bacillus sp. DJP31 TaxID=3409789 RepID=UPI003BB7FC3D